MSDELKATIEYLESYQEECLRDRFGKDFLKKVATLRAEPDIDSFVNELVQKDSRYAPMAAELLNYAKSEYDSTILLTRFEAYYSHRILKEVFDKIEGAAEGLGNKATSTPFIGSAASRQYNAFAAKVPKTGNYLIVFESELFTLANLLAKIIASCLPDFTIAETKVSFSFSRDRIIDHISKNQELQQRFSQLVYHGIFIGEPNRCPQYLLTGHGMKLQYNLLLSLELFVVGHEYGHIIAGHLNDANLKSLQIKNNIIQKINPNWEMEYEADRIGLLLLGSSTDESCLFPFFYLGPELFFSFLDLVERANNLYAGGREKRSKGSDTHPPTFERRTRIRDLIKSGLRHDHLESYIVASKFLEDILELLWDNFKKTQKK